MVDRDLPEQVDQAQIQISVEIGQQLIFYRHPHLMSCVVCHQPPSKMLPDQLRDAIRVKYYSYSFVVREGKGNRKALICPQNQWVSAGWQAQVGIYTRIYDLVRAYELHIDLSRS